MKFKLMDLEFALAFASADGGESSTVLVDKASGEIYCQSEYTDEEIPEEAWDSDDVVRMPPKKELDLGSRLVFRFVEEVFPDGCDRVREIFSRRGAYARYKDWLECNGLLDQWYDYSNTAEKEAIREWCADEGIELEE